MANRRHKMQAGVLAVAGLGLLTLSLLGWVASGLRHNTMNYTVELKESATGLESGSEVKYLGVTVGEVTDINLVGSDPPSVVIGLEIEEGTPIRLGTAAGLRRNFLTGATHVELSGGTGTTLLPVDSRLPWHETPMARFQAELPVLGEQLVEATSRIRDLLDPENQRVIRDSLVRWEHLLDRAERDLDELKSAAQDVHGVMDSRSERLVISVEAASRDMKMLGRSFQEQVQGISDDFLGRIDQHSLAFQNRLEVGIEQAIATLAQGVDALERSSAAVQLPAEKMNELLNQNHVALGRAVTDLEESSRVLKGLLQLLERDPSALIFSPPAKERRRGD